MILAVAATIGALCVLVLLIARPPVGLAALAFFFPFNQFVPFTPLPGLNAETLLVVVAVGMTVLRFGARLPPLRLSGAVFAYILVLLMGLAVTASWYTDWFPLHTNWDNFKNVKHLVLATSFFLTAYWWFRTDRDRRMLLQVFSIGVGAVAAVGILDYFVPLRPRIDSSLVRSVGIFRDPNVLAGYLAAYSLVPLYLIRRRDISGPFRLVCIFIYALAAIDLVLTLSRSGWLAALVGHTVWFGLTDRRLLIAGAFAFVALTSVAYPFLPEVVRDRVEATFEPGTVIFQSGATSRSLESSAGARVAVWRVGWSIFLESPLWGRGLESIRILTPQYGARYGLVRHVPSHNLYLQIAAEMGLIGVMVFGWLALVSVRQGWILWRSSSSERGLGALLLGSAAAFATSNFFAVVAFQGLVAVYFWMMIGLVAGARTAQETAGTESRTLGRDYSLSRVIPANEQSRA